MSRLRCTLFLLFSLLISTAVRAELPSCYRAHCSHCLVKFIAMMCPETCGPCPKPHRANTSPVVEIIPPKVKSPTTGGVARSPQSHTFAQPSQAAQPQIPKAYGQKSNAGIAGAQRLDGISGAASSVHNGGSPVNSGNANITPPRGPPVAHGLPPQPIEESPRQLPLFAPGQQQRLLHVMGPPPAPPSQQHHQVAAQLADAPPQSYQHQQLAVLQQPVYQQAQPQYFPQFSPQQFYPQPSVGYQQSPMVYQQPPPAPATVRPPTYLNPIPQQPPPQPQSPQQFYQPIQQPAQIQAELQRPRQIYNQVASPQSQPQQPQPVPHPFSQFTIPQLPHHHSFHSHPLLSQQPQAPYQIMGVPPPPAQFLPQTTPQPQQGQPAIPPPPRQHIIPAPPGPGIIIPPMMPTLIPAPRPAAPPPPPPPPPAVTKSFGEKEGEGAAGGALEGTCPKAPNWEPCIPKSEANQRFKECCQPLGAGCSSMCSYDQTLANIQLAVLTGRCPLNKVADMMICASGFEDATPCCEAFGVFGPGYEQCRPYCNPAGGLPTAADGNLAEKYRCLGKMPIIQRCFYISQKP